MTMTARMPPFKSIEAFVVAARALSFTAAATTLHITLPAVSRRIQALENDLGVPLFQRKHRALMLTATGEAYFASLEPAIDAIRRASQHVRIGGRPRSVKVDLPASLAANWLVPRLHRFHAKHRGVQVELESISKDAELESASEHPPLNNAEADIVIQLGNGNWPGLRTARLLDLEGFPVCSPSLLGRDTVLPTLDDLGELPLLGIRGQSDLWQRWFRSAGLTSPVRIDQEFDNLHLLYRAAACGLGVALGVDVLVQPYLDEGQLVRPFNSQFRLGKSYYLICRAADLSRRPVSVFRDWLLTQAAPSAPPPERQSTSSPAEPLLQQSRRPIGGDGAGMQRDATELERAQTVVVQRPK
jgi:LysR family glycine cleavage system transcriptional activator